NCLHSMESVNEHQGSIRQACDLHGAKVFATSHLDHVVSDLPILCLLPDLHQGCGCELGKRNCHGFCPLASIALVALLLCRHSRRSFIVSARYCVRRSFPVGCGLEVQICCRVGRLEHLPSPMIPKGKLSNIHIQGL